MKIIFQLIPFLLFANSTVSQNLDTIKLNSKFPIVTDKSLNDNGNCMTVDTLITFHDCISNLYIESLLVYYQFDTTFCDSISAIQNLSERNKLIDEAKEKIQSTNQSKIIRIIQPNFNDSTYSYTPEILFQVELGDSIYYFNSIYTKHSIPKNKLKKEFRIIDRIPNASKLFGNKTIHIELIKDDYSNSIEIIELETESFQYNKKTKLNSLKFRIQNDCKDELVMLFEFNN